MYMANHDKNHDLMVSLVEVLCTEDTLYFRHWSIKITNVVQDCSSLMNHVEFLVNVGITYGSISSVFSDSVCFLLIGEVLSEIFVRCYNIECLG